MLVNLNSETLIDISVNKEGCTLTDTGVLCTYTGSQTGRSPGAKKIVEDDLTRDTVDWSNNIKISPEEFEDLYLKFMKFKNTHKNLYLQEVSAVRDREYSLDINVWSEFARHSLFTRNMLIPKESDEFDASYNVYHFPTLLDKPTVVISFEKRVILISGTLYAGEIKKSVFTVLNYWFPKDYGFLPMHCSVNTDKDGTNPAVFFGLSGTGKTTLSSDLKRVLIGDDEHGWTDKGLVNFENGCYAKTINLSKEAEPQIWSACRKKGTMLENVVLKDGVPNFDDGIYTQNTRASYPTGFIENASECGYVNEHPKNIIMLTCDSFGVLPPVAKLGANDAVHQFLLGYTSKVAGTEEGVVEPQATFSPCFGLPFMPLAPEEYGKILRRKINKHVVNCWMVNTGWTGGPYGTGRRIPIKTTRLIIDKILDGTLAKSKIFIHEHTGCYIPLCREIDENILIPEKGWKNISEYKKAASLLMMLFKERSEK